MLKVRDGSGLQASGEQYHHVHDDGVSTPVTGSCENFNSAMSALSMCNYLNTTFDKTHNYLLIQQRCVVCDS